MNLKQKILHSIYNIEQYLGNLKLDSGLVAECKLMVRRANTEVDDDNLDELMEIERELELLNKKMDAVVGASLGLQDDGDTAVEKEKNQKDDTKPFKIFKG